MTLVLSGGLVMTADGWQETDVVVEDGRISDRSQAGAVTEKLDATGCLIGPGLVDMHCHVREPGETWKEDLESVGEAAAAGGFTALVAMPNTVPPLDSKEITDHVISAGAQRCAAQVIPSAAMTVGRRGEEPAPLEDLYRSGVRLFTDDGDSVTDDAVLRDVMARIARLSGAFVAQHAEDPELTSGAHLAEGDVSRSLGIPGMPPEAETDVVRRDLELVAETGAHYHAQHVSAGATVQLLRVAKEAGLPVTAEVTPHHLVFDESDVAGLDPNFKMYPPLRSAADREELLRALLDGTIDVVATDHAPHAAEEKAVPFDRAPRGVTGLETAMSAVWETLGEPQRLFEVLSVAPARIMGMASQGNPLRPGDLANVVVFDPHTRWAPEQFASKSANSPFLGREMTGRVRATFRTGVMTYRLQMESS